MATYLLLNPDNIVVNAIEYDGVSEYSLDEGYYLMPFDEEIRNWIGWSYIDGVWTAPEPIVDEAAANRESAIEKLSALGLSDSEISALLGFGG